MMSGEELLPLIAPGVDPVRVIGLMSGSGSNLVRILENQVVKGTECPYEMVGVFSDNPDSNVGKIAKEFGIPAIIHDINEFYGDKPMNDMEVRQEYDHASVKMMRELSPEVAAFGGYMKVATMPLVDAFLGINVHPADLTVMLERPNGYDRKFTGDHAVRDAILAGETELRSSIHIIEPVVDGGRLLMVSDPLNVEYPSGTDMTNVESIVSCEDHNQDRLKEAGDWVVFPKSLEYLARGMYSIGVSSGTLHFNGDPIPNGITPNGTPYKMAGAKR